MKPISLLSKCALAAIVIVSAITSCKKENTDSQPVQSTVGTTVSGFGNISYFARASATAVKTGSAPAIKTQAADATVAVDWASAYLYVEKISFTGQGLTLIDSTISVEKKIDIFNASALAGVIKLPAGSYKNVSVKLYCRKLSSSAMAFNLHGIFTNTQGTKDSVMVGSSLPFTAIVPVSDISLNPSDKYKATFNFDLSKVLTGITTALLQTARPTVGTDGKKTYIIWKGGSAEEPFFDQVVSNWQTVATATVAKDN